MVVIGDVHGCLKELKLLLNKIGDKEICFVGDLIDRGKESAEVVAFVRENNYLSIMGNHEDMFIHHNDDRDSYYHFIGNGGDSTLESYKGKEEQMKSDLLWMKDLPITMNYTNSKGETFIISHSFMVNHNRNRNHPNFKYDALWSRINTLKTPVELDEDYNVTGHTPVENVTLAHKIIWLDTGCTFGRFLSAIDLETFEVYSSSSPTTILDKN